jgi:erythromycin esterase-like protein
MVHIQQFASSFASIARKGKPAEDLTEQVAQSAKPLDYRSILDTISDDVDVVLIGEASHGTHEFYHHRAEITKLLMLEKGFNMIGLEADWPDTRRVNEYVLNHRNSKDKNALQSLSDYTRFPLWMWRNEVMVNFIEWLRQHNDSRVSDSDKCELFGMDVYSYENSRDAVLAFLDKYDPEMPGLAAMAEEAYQGTKRRANAAKAERVVKSLEKYLNLNPHFEELFNAVQNARCVKGAAEYYNVASTGDSSWNYRDTFMFETLKRVMDRRSFIHGQRAKTVIWAHNSHLGDSRYTHKHSRGELTVGRLIREHWGLQRTVNIGFTTFDGSVTATDEWGLPCTFKKVNPGMTNSVEELFHNALGQASSRFPDGKFLLVFRTTGSSRDKAEDSVIEQLGTHSYLERAIGVIYRPSNERRSHYFDCRIAKQFDMVIHIDRTNALRPLDIPEQWAENEKYYSR